MEGTRNKQNHKKINPTYKEQAKFYKLVRWTYKKQDM